VSHSARANREAPQNGHLTVKEIRGLLTRLSHDLVRSLRAEHRVDQAPMEAELVEPARFIASMSPFLRMN
jgi:hypothetical protein